MIDAELRQLIGNCLEEVAKSSSHSLAPISRRAIYEYLRSKAANHDRARAYLDYLSVLKIRPLIDDYHDYIHEYDVDRNISLIQSLIEGSGSREKGLAMADNLSDKLMREIDESSEEMGDEFGGELVNRDFNPEFIPFAILEALYCSCGVYRFDDVIVRDNMRDTEFDVWSSDTARWAMLAYCGDELSGVSNLKRRREFWLWWLNEAVPVAYEYYSAGNDVNP
jgi:hypothetical protein